MGTSRWRQESRARRPTAALCLSLLLGLAWGLHGWTRGFEVWTFEDLRRERAPSGELVAAPVALRGADGGPVSLWTDGTAPSPRALLVDFVYTRCPSLCRVLGSEYQQMQNELSERHEAGVQLASISFDVEHDGPEQLEAYATVMHTDPQLWTVAAPATVADAHRLLGSLGVVAVSDGAGGFVHNGAIHLLDARGRVRGLYEFDQWPRALAAARRLAAGTARDHDSTGSP